MAMTCALNLFTKKPTHVEKTKDLYITNQSNNEALGDVFSKTKSWSIVVNACDVSLVICYPKNEGNEELQ